MKKLLMIIIPIAIVGVGYFGFNKLSKRKGGGQEITGDAKGFDGKVHYKFVSLPEGVIGQSGELQVLEEEVERTAPMRSFRNKERDVLFAMIYKQFVTNNENPVKKIEFSFKKVSLSPSAILSQYGIKQKYETKIEFQTFDASEGLAKIDGQVISEEDVEFNSFIWAAHETEIFRYKLDEIDRILKRKVVAAESKKLGLRAQDYQDKYVFQKLPTEISEKDINAYLKKYNIEDSERNRASAKNNLLRIRKDRGLNYILEKYVMDLPIKVSLKAPEYKLDTKNEWTATWGEPGGLSVTLFSGTRNSKTVELLKSLFPIFKKYGSIHFFYRPFFFDDDALQNLTSQMHFCVLIGHRDQFWDYFQATLGDFRNETEQTLYAKADEVGIDSQSMKKCLVDQKYKEVVDYHMQYAKYLGITSGPVLYIGGEVLHGAILPADVEDIIQRKLNIPAAGMW